MAQKEKQGMDPELSLVSWIDVAQVTHYLGTDWLARRAVFPLEMSDDHIIILGMVDTEDIRTLEDVRLNSGFECKPIACLQEKIEKLIDRAKELGCPPRSHRTPEF